MNVLENGECPHCGHPNEARWVFCDTCGRRLPWAEPEPPKKSLSDLSDEEIALATKPNDRPEPFFLLTPPGRALLSTLVIAAAFYWIFIFER